ncbi:MAG: MMPL family transporter [Planctomycetaceae bacterium]|jgi:predicted RND superfamily exporter protein|nr:MMPL family transporter [Planctomycetaceae bacterium]
MSPSKKREFLNRPLRLLLIWSSIILFAFAVWSAAEARKKTTNRVVDWLPQGTKELQVFNERYIRHFPEGEYLMISWKGCNTEDERLDTVAEKVMDPPAYFARAMTTRSVIESLTSDVPYIDEEGAENRLAGWLIGQNRKDACMVVSMSEKGWNNPATAIEFLFTTVEQETGLPRSDIYIAGPSIDSVAIDEISSKSQRTLLPFFLAFSFILLLCCLRNGFAAVLVFWAAIINEELAGTILYWSGAHVDSISMLTSSLVYVLTISGGVHLINYYKETLSEMMPGEEFEAPRKTLNRALIPCSLASITTILGMGSLAVSKMVPIQTFGIYASLTLFIGTVFLFLFILSVLQEYPIKKWYPDRYRNDIPDELPKLEFWERFGNVVFRYRLPTTVCTFALLVFFAFNVQYLKTSVTFHGLLPKTAKVLQDYAELENRIGGLIPLEIVVQFPDGVSGRKMLDQLHFLSAAVEALKQTENVDTVISVLNFVPNLPSRTGGGTRAAVMRSSMEGLLTRHKDRLKDLRFFDSVESGEDAGTYWRISLRVSTQKKADYPKMVQEVQNRLEQFAVQQREQQHVIPAGGAASDRLEKAIAPQPRFDVTGGVPLVIMAQELLLWDLIYSFTAAFGLIAVTMMIMLKGVMRGLLSMVPNVFPCVVVFGLLGLCDIPVDMGSMMTASVALGISVDGTLHLLTWVHIGLKRGLLRRDAVQYAYHHCSTALFQTTLICGVGMLIFGLSDFVPVARFAELLFVILVVALSGYLISLPAILFSRLGKFFDRVSSHKRPVIPVLPVPSMPRGEKKGKETDKNKKTKRRKNKRR